jgi:hypothetical protein
MIGMVKKGYHYLFYKFYKFSEAAPSKWLSDWKASLTLDVLVVLLFTSFLNYYKVLVSPKSHSGEDYLLFIVLAIINIVNYLIFHHKDKWKAYVYQFDKLPKKINIIGSWVVLITVIIIVTNFILSFYLYYQS